MESAIFDFEGSPGSETVILEVLNIFFHKVHFTTFLRGMRIWLTQRVPPGGHTVFTIKLQIDVAFLLIQTVCAPSCQWLSVILA